MSCGSVSASPGGERELPFADAAGRAWTVIDYRVDGRKKKRVPLGDRRADGRAFVPDGWTGPVMLRSFGLWDYHTTEPKILEGQLHFAKPVGANALERMQSPAL
jgi:hypothetical protein